jgi:hypothetical protein
MYKLFFIPLIALLVQPAFSQDGESGVLTCHSKASVDFGKTYTDNEKSKKKSNEPEKPTPQFTIIVSGEKNNFKAQAYTPKAGHVATPSSAHNVQFVGDKSSGVCKLTLTEIGNPKRLTIKMIMDNGSSDELVYYLGKNVSKSEIQHLNCSTDFEHDLAKFCDK